jgi:hypothetical protein
MVKVDATSPTEEVVPRKRGVFRRLFRRGGRKAKDAVKMERRDRTPSPTGSIEESGRDDVPEMHPDSAVPSPSETSKSRRVKPSAREAAFSGPPRYEWADIVRSVV